MQKCRPAIASMSLGRAFAGHDLFHKLECAARNGFEGVEIFYEDLEYLARKQPNGEEEEEEEEEEGESPTKDQLLTASKLVREKCAELGLTIIGLQPFLFYEGLKDRGEHERLIEKLHVWFAIVKVLGTDIIQIPTQFRQDDGVTGDMGVIVADMIEVADLGLKEAPPVKFAYENLAWGRFVDTWQGIWDVVSRVNRWNFGVCLDTFNIAGRVWADPGRKEGVVEAVDGLLEESIKAMVETVDVKKVWYVQVVGAEKLEQPLVEGHEWYVKGQPSRMSWSRNARLFYGEDDKGQYLPIEKVARAILEPVDQGGMGFVGWVSMELFSRTMNDEEEKVPAEHAKRGGNAWVKLTKDLSL